MGAIKEKLKPIDVNPIRLSQPMGATLAYLGIDGCMPLMHGAQGCASFTKVFYTRHFNEPIALQTTAVSDITAVLDGGDYSITEAIKNITKKTTPSLIGLHTTGLTETKGDDVRGVAAQVDFPLVYVNTPDYEGGLESGWAMTVASAMTVEAIIDQLVEPTTQLDDAKAAILPNVSLRPIEVEKLMEFVQGFGFEAFALPDLSTSLDGHLGEKQGSVSSGGISVDAIRELGSASVVITIGASMRIPGEALVAKNPAMRHVHLDGVMGLEATDTLVEALMAQKGLGPKAVVKRWRTRLQDALLDAHFAIGGRSFLLAGEPDFIYGIATAIREAGGLIPLAIVSNDSPVNETIPAEKVWVGDLGDAESFMNSIDCIVTNTHGERLAKRYKKAFVCRGYPDWETVGNTYQYEILYEGGCYLLSTIANAITEYEHHEH